MSQRLLNLELSIIIPTYNESDNIIRLIEAILPYTNNINTEILIVDDNSPDNTGLIVESYAKNNKCIRVIHRNKKEGLSKAILHGINEARGNKIIIMDADFSHPPSVIPTIINELNNNDLVIASRYIKGGKIINWPFKRKLISKCAKILANYILSIKIRDPLSGFFGFKKNIINNIEFDALGYKLLLEIIVKCNNIKVKEIPYTFINRSFGKSKLSISVMIDYLRSIIRLYRYGRRSVYGIKERRRSVLFLSKAGRFYTVGLGGLAVNYITSLLLSTLIGEFYGTLGGILSSITSNFILNKVWTFEDNNFKPKHVFKQYGLYLSISSLGAIIQISLINILSNLHKLDYPLALLIGVGIASISNFLFNKKFTFKENVWG